MKNEHLAQAMKDADWEKFELLIASILGLIERFIKTGEAQEMEFVDGKIVVTK